MKQRGVPFLHPSHPSHFLWRKEFPELLRLFSLERAPCEAGPWLASRNLDLGRAPPFPGNTMSKLSKQYDLCWALALPQESGILVQGEQRVPTWAAPSSHHPLTYCLLKHFLDIRLPPSPALVGAACKSMGLKQAPPVYWVPHVFLRQGCK